MASKIVVDFTSIQELPDRLPPMVASLSLGRAQIVVDQVRAVVQESSDSQRMIWITAKLDSGGTAVSGSTDSPAHASVLAIENQCGLLRLPSDAVTVLHGCQFGADASGELMESLGLAFDDELRRRNIRFVQWATDALDENGSSNTADLNTHALCRGFGFEPLATLRYLTVKLSPADTQTEQQLCLQPVELNDREAFSRWQDLVAQTYLKTLDCPRLNDFRSVEQTLSAYQAVDSFRKNRWYTVHTREQAAGFSTVPIGVVIMAGHAHCTSNHRLNQTSELVYMALVPEARGRSWGRALFRLVINEAIDAKSEQLVLAVDEQNLGGRTIYEHAHDKQSQEGREPMQLILRETVWGKRV